MGLEPGTPKSVPPDTMNEKIDNFLKNKKMKMKFWDDSP